MSFRRMLTDLLGLVLGLLLLLNGCGEAGHITGPGVDECDRPVDWHWSRVCGGTWSPDGREIAFETMVGPDGQPNAGIYIANLETGAVRQVLRFPYMMVVYRMSWSPTRPLLLANPRGAIHVIDAIADTTRMLVYDPERQILGGAWTPEGDSLYYCRLWKNGESPDSAGIFVTSLANGGRGRELLASDGRRLVPGWVEPSPDGRWLAFQQIFLDSRGEPTNEVQICVIRRDGTGFRQLTHMKHGSSGQPRWIEGGQAIAFQFRPNACPDFEGHTWVVRLDSGRVMRYSSDLGDRAVQWSMNSSSPDPTGRWLAGPRYNPASEFGDLYVTNLKGGMSRLVYGPPVLP